MFFVWKFSVVERDLSVLVIHGGINELELVVCLMFENRGLEPKSLLSICLTSFCLVGVLGGLT